MKKSKKKYGSALVFALIVLFIGVVAALGVASTTVISRKMSGATGKSTASFQVADSGAEVVLKKIKESTNPSTDLISTLWPSSCSSGVVSGSIVSGKDYNVTFFDDADPPIQLQCTDKVSQIAKIKSTGTYGGTSRAIEAAVGQKSKWLYGGMFEKDNNSNSCEEENVLTGDCTCPTGYSSVVIRETAEWRRGDLTSYPDWLYLCWKERTGNEQGWKFGGMFEMSQKNSEPEKCDEENPITGDCTCPNGYEKNIVGKHREFSLISTDVTDYNLYACNSANKGADEYFFGGTYELGESDTACNSCSPHQIGSDYCEMQNPLISTIPASLLCSCPSGFTANKVTSTPEGTGSSHDDLYLCWK